MITVGEPAATMPPCAVASPSRAAGEPAMTTLEDPPVIASGGPTHTHASPIRAAG
jgi:hypothetical protein